MSNQFIIKDKNYKKESEEIEEVEKTKNNNELNYYKRISFYENFYDTKNSTNSIYSPLPFFYDTNNNIIELIPSIKTITLNNSGNIPINLYYYNDPFYSVCDELTSKLNVLENMVGNNVPNYNVPNYIISNKDIKNDKNNNDKKNYNLIIYSKNYN